jgi:DNA repair exonuclease SbcCD ATPase subunit
LFKEELGLEEMEKAFRKTEKTLKRNLEMEKSKRVEELKKIHSLQKTENTELYAELQQLAQNLVLKGRFFLEKLNLRLAQKEKTVLEKSASSKEWLKLLEQKERELQELRKEYEAIRRKTFLGFIPEETAADLEHEAIALAKRFERERAHLEAQLQKYAQKLTDLDFSYKEISEKARDIEELFSQHAEKTNEFVRILKKERDFAKKTLLDLEAELLQLRNTYSKGLLNLEDTKQKTREALEEKFSKHMKKLKEELKEKTEMLQHFRDLVHEREKALHEKEEEIEFLYKELKKQKHRKK